jgi:hypothetical protein
MNESQLAEVEKALLYIAEARDRAARTRRELERQEAEPHVIAALEASELTLAAEHRRLMQAAFFAVPSDQDRLAV